MTRHTAFQLSPVSHSTSLAVACAALWFLAAIGAGFVGIWLAIGGAAVVLGGGVLLLDGATRQTLRWPSPRLAGLGVASGAAMCAATYALYPGLSRVLPLVATDTQRLYAAFRAPSPELASLALLVIIAGEELVWRGVVQAALTRRLGPWGGVVSAASAYALAHAPLGSPVLMAAALGCGLAWGALRAMTGSLVPTLVAHLLWDALVLLWLPVEAG